VEGSFLKCGMEKVDFGMSRAKKIDIYILPKEAFLKCEFQAEIE
jgi:hypothetical protein